MRGWDRAVPVFTALYREVARPKQCFFVEARVRDMVLGVTRSNVEWGVWFLMGW